MGWISCQRKVPLKTTNKHLERNVKMNQNFNQKCYELLRKIPKGKVTTYKEMANALGTNAWRAVGSAMAKNSDLINTPCHRVVRSDGNIGQYALGKDKKAELLRNEGIELLNGKVKDLNHCLYRFNSSCKL